MHHHSCSRENCVLRCAVRPCLSANSQWQAPALRSKRCCGTTVADPFTRRLSFVLKQRNPLLYLAFLLPPFCSQLARAAEPPKLVITKQVEPDWRSHLRLSSRAARSQLRCRYPGEPFSIQARTAIPDNVVRALMQWRFKAGNFIVPLNVVVRLPLTPSFERAQTPRLDIHRSAYRR